MWFFDGTDTIVEFYYEPNKPSCKWHAEYNGFANTFEIIEVM